MTMGMFGPMDLAIEGSDHHHHHQNQNQFQQQGFQNQFQFIGKNSLKFLKLKA